MVKYIVPSKLSRSKRVACKTISGAKVEDVYDVTDKLVKTHRVSEVIFHVGTNNLQCNDPSVIATKLESLGEQILTNCNSVEKVSISSIMHRRKPHIDLQKKADDVNRLILDMTTKHGWGYIDNSVIDSERHLVSDGLHLNHVGVKIFASSLAHHINHVIGDETSPIHLNQAPKQQLYEPITSPPPPHRYADVAAKRFPRSAEGPRSQTRPLQTTNQRSEHLTHPRRAPSDSIDNVAFSEPWYTHSAYRGCFNCGEMNHKQHNCYFESKIQCHTCKNFGHKAKYCVYHRAN